MVLILWDWVSIGEEHEGQEAMRTYEMVHSSNFSCHQLSTCIKELSHFLIHSNVQLVLFLYFGIRFAEVTR
jgi:hypothetical protein